MTFCGFGGSFGDVIVKAASFGNGGMTGGKGMQDHLANVQGDGLWLLLSFVLFETEELKLFFRLMTVTTYLSVK